MSNIRHCLTGMILYRTNLCVARAACVPHDLSLTQHLSCTSAPSLYEYVHIPVRAYTQVHRTSYMHMHIYI